MENKKIQHKTFQECSLAELKREAQRQTAMKQLKCPECGETVDAYSIDAERNVEFVLFKCAFSATFDRGVHPEEAQKKLNDFQKSGEMEKWLKKGLF